MTIERLGGKYLGLPEVKQPQARNQRGNRSWDRCDYGSAV
jgi:hypothetical protein